MNMIEKVARAICNALEDDWDNAPDESINANLCKREYKEFAQAAIEAMREPSEDMLDELYSKVGGGEHPFGNSQEDCLDGYQEMINKALES